jgi:hypothetical protein
VVEAGVAAIREAGDSRPLAVTAAGEAGVAAGEASRTISAGVVSADSVVAAASADSAVDLANAKTIAAAAN